MIPTPLVPIVLWLMMHMPISQPLEVVEFNPTHYGTILSNLPGAKTGFVCVSDKDIMCLEDICNDKVAHTYWTIKVDGDYNVNSRTVVGPREKVKLEYAELKEE